MNDRYTAAGHRIQTSIGTLILLDPKYRAVEPKHMRTGLDLSKSDMCGLARLLIEKGLFTEDEYIEALTKAAEDEADRYEKEVHAIFSNRKREKGGT